MDFVPSICPSVLKTFPYLFIGNIVLWLSIYFKDVFLSLILILFVDKDLNPEKCFYNKNATHNYVTDIELSFSNEYSNNPSSTGEGAVSEGLGNLSSVTDRVTHVLNH